MVFDVPVNFGFDAVEAVGNNAVVVTVFFHELINERHDDRETATDNSHQHSRIHCIRALELC